MLDFLLRVPTYIQLNSGVAGIFSRQKKHEGITGR